MKAKRGFTIVELLIVIVVIAILAAITVAAYNGIQNRAKDSAVQSDLNNIAKKITEYTVINGVAPTSDTELATMNFRVSKNAYGNHFDNGSGKFNLVYCWPGSSNGNKIGIAAATVSGKMFGYSNGTVKEYPLSSWSGGSSGICANIGNNIENTGTRSWFYSYDTWQPIAG